MYPLHKSADQIVWLYDYAILENQSAGIEQSTQNPNKKTLQTNYDHFHFHLPLGKSCSLSLFLHHSNTQKKINIINRLTVCDETKTIGSEYPRVESSWRTLYILIEYFCSHNDRLHKYSSQKYVDFPIIFRLFPFAVRRKCIKMQCALDLGIFIKIPFGFEL